PARREPPELRSRALSLPLAVSGLRPAVPDAGGRRRLRAAPHAPQGGHRAGAGVPGERGAHGAHRQRSDGDALATRPGAASGARADATNSRRRAGERQRAPRAPSGDAARNFRLPDGRGTQRLRPRARIRAVRASSLRVSRDRAVSLLDLAAAIHLAAAASARVGGGRGRVTTRHASAAPRWLGSIWARGDPSPLAGNGSRRPLPPPVLALAAVSLAGVGRRLAGGGGVR